MTEGADPALPTEELAGLALSDFDGLVGTSFTVETEAGAQALMLTVAQAVPGSPRPEGGFRLEFTGPPQPRLPQSIYAFPLGGAPRDIFVVPIGPGPDQRLRYEAIFF